MKQIYEFDYAAQDPELSQAQLESAVGAYVQAEGITSLVVHQKRSSKSKKLIEGFLSWGDGELTPEQLTSVSLILQSQYGLVGYTNPVPDPQVVSLMENATLATLVMAPYVPAIGALDQISIYAGATSWTGGSETFYNRWLARITNDAGTGNHFLLMNTGTGTPGLNPNPSLMDGLFIELKNMDSTGGPLTVPPGDLTIQLDGGQTLLVDNVNPLVIPAPIADGLNVANNFNIGWYWIDNVGKVYPFYTQIGGVRSYIYPWLEAIQLPRL